MSYIVKQKIKGKDYYYLRESRREGKKVKSISVAYLGKTRKEAEEKLLELINKTINRGGKVLIPELGLGRSQETMLILEDAIKTGKTKETKRECRSQGSVKAIFENQLESNQVPKRRS